MITARLRSLPSRWRENILEVEPNEDHRPAGAMPGWDSHEEKYGCDAGRAGIRMSLMYVPFV